MPRATVNLADTERVELKSLPPDSLDEGGFVVLRRLTYGQKIQRQQLAMEVSMHSTDNRRNSSPEMAMKMTQERVTVFDFGNCIVDHNLEDENGKKLDFRQPQAVFMLDPRVGEEISNHMDDMNNFEDDEDLKNSETGFGQQSSPTGNPSPMSLS
jgi:hypothetical protein